MSANDWALRAYLAGALDPGARADVEARLAATPAMRGRLEQLAAEISALRSEASEEDPGVGRWRVPAPGAWAPFGLQAAPVGVMDSGDLPRPGDRIRLAIQPRPGGSEDRAVVVLWRGDGGWQVAFPRRPGQRVPLSALPVDDDGARWLDAVARPDARRQRWAIALAPAELSIDGEGPTRWSALIAAVARGEAEVTSVEVEVAV